MTQNLHVYAICCRPEVGGEVISGGKIRTIEGYAVLNFEVAIFSSFRDIQNKSFFVTAAAAAGEADIDDGIKRKRIRVSLKTSDSFHFIPT